MSDSSPLFSKTKLNQPLGGELTQDGSGLAGEEFSIHSVDDSTREIPGPMVGRRPLETHSFRSRDLPDDPHAAQESGWPSWTWDRYRFARLLGSGGMGRVFKAWDPQLQRFVALKLLLGDAPERVERFLREAKAQARVDHPCVCKVYESGLVEDRPYIAMQLIDGESLANLAPRLSVEELTLILKQVAEGVHAAHRTGLVHRDLKPGNIMVERDEDGSLRPYVVDFGLVLMAEEEALTVSGTAIGTPAFMAPEMAMGQTHGLDRRSDVYSLGATLYAVLSGGPPFRGETAMEVLFKVVGEEPQPLRRIAPNLPEDLQTIVQKCMEKQPALRYDSARALAEDLGRFLDGEPLRAQPVSLFGRMVRRAKRNKPLVSVALGGALVTLLALGWGWNSRRHYLKQMELGERFGRWMEQSEALLWRNYALELHDVRQVRSQVLQQMDKIRLEMKQYGRLSLGPGHAALGRAHMSLGELPQARENLEKAWSRGYRTPEVAYSLGWTLGQAYHLKRQEAFAIRDQSLRRKKTMELERTLRDPALAYLRECSGTSLVDPEFIHALLASYECLYEEALSRSDRVLARLPWFYEAWALKGRIYEAQALESRLQGDFRQTKLLFEATDRAYLQALRIGRSDPRLWLAMLQARKNYLSTQLWYLGVWNDELFRSIEKHFPQLDIIDPESSDALGLHAELLSDAAEYHLHKMKDPKPFLDKGRRIAENLQRLKPRDAKVKSLLASIDWRYGKWESANSRSGLKDFDRGLQLAREAVALEPHSTDFQSTLGLLYLEKGTQMLRSNSDLAKDSLNQAVAAFETCMFLEPDEAAHPVNLGIALLQLINLLSESKADHAPVFQKARAALGKAMELQPNFFWTYRSLGELDYWEAWHDHRAGRDPRPRLLSARTHCDRALQINPEDFNSVLTKIRTLVFNAEIEKAGSRERKTYSSQGMTLIRQLESRRFDPFEVSSLKKDLCKLEGYSNLLSR